jgi:hypothetical protein
MSFYTSLPVLIGICRYLISRPEPVAITSGNYNATIDRSLLWVCRLCTSIPGRTAISFAGYFSGLEGHQNGMKKV